MVWLTVFWICRLALQPAFLDEPASLFGIAVAHSIFNVLCTVLMLPLSGFLERLVIRLVPEAKQPETHNELDERLLYGRDHCRHAGTYVLSHDNRYRRAVANLPRNRQCLQNTHGRYEDILGTYLIRLSTKQISEADSAEAAKLLKMIGDFERISDHAVNLLESAEELRDKGLTFTAAGAAELAVGTETASGTPRCPPGHCGGTREGSCRTPPYPARSRQCWSSGRRYVQSL